MDKLLNGNFYIYRYSLSSRMTKLESFLFLFLFKKNNNKKTVTTAPKQQNIVAIKVWILQSADIVLQLRGWVGEGGVSE